jgi:peptide/nickel transport system permease protein
MLYGKKLNCYAYPIYNVTFVADSVCMETYTGSEPNDGELKKFHLADVAFALNEKCPIIRNGDSITFTTMQHGQQTLTISQLQEVVKAENLATRTFVLGTDRYGRDVLSQIMLGSRVSLSVGFIAIAIALIIGIVLGSLAAYYGGAVDSAIMWFINVVWSIPTVLLVIAITFVLGKGFWQVFVAVGLTMWVDVARVVRGQVLSIKEKEYVEAAKALGFTPFRTIFNHVLPNIWGAVIVIAASNFASAILLEAGLSFLGIGVQPPMPSWGTMVKENYAYILLDSAYLALIPGFAIMLIVLAFMIVGSGIRNALDIKNN